MNELPLLSLFARTVDMLEQQRQIPHKKVRILAHPDSIESIRLASDSFKAMPGKASYRFNFEPAPEMSPGVLVVKSDD